MTPKLYKAGEVCELLQVQPYVLRSWEKEFPGIGVQKSPESPRLYRQSDVEHVQQIKQLVFGEGLTVSGARRRLETLAPVASAVTALEAAEVFEVLGEDVRARIAVVREGLREIQSILSAAPGTSNGHGARPTEFTLKAPAAKPAKKEAPKARTAASRGKAVKRAAPKRPAARKKPAKRKHARA